MCVSTDGQCSCHAGGDLETETTSKRMTTKTAMKNKPDHLFPTLQATCDVVLMIMIKVEMRD